MNSGFIQTLKSALFPSNLPFYTSVRHRYYAEKIAKGPLQNRYGYKDPIFVRGILPRLKNANHLPMPIYRPGNQWNPELATKGQNDYIDILGGMKLKPAEISYDVPQWLRGRKGNEFQLLMLKHNVFKNTRYPSDYPKAWYNLNKRINYLYKFFNIKLKTSHVIKS